MILSMVSYQISASLPKQLFTVLDPLSVRHSALMLFALIYRLRDVPFLAHSKAAAVVKMAWFTLLQRGALHHECFVLYVARKAAARHCSRSGIYWPLGFGPAVNSAAQRYVWVLLAIAGIALMVPWGQTRRRFFCHGCSLRAGCRIVLGFLYLFGQKVVHQNISMHVTMPTSPYQHWLCCPSASTTMRP